MFDVCVIFAPGVIVFKIMFTFPYISAYWASWVLN